MDVINAERLAALPGLHVHYIGLVRVAVDVRWQSPWPRVPSGQGSCLVAVQVPDLVMLAAWWMVVVRKSWR